MPHFQPKWTSPTNVNKQLQLPTNPRHVMEYPPTSRHVVVCFWKDTWLVVSEKNKPLIVVVSWFLYITMFVVFFFFLRGNGNCAMGDTWNHRWLFCWKKTSNINRFTGESERKELPFGGCHFPEFESSNQNYSNDFLDNHYQWIFTFWHPG